MAQIARPASDITSGNWTPSTGTTLWEVLDETTFSDSDYVSSGDATDTFEVKLSSLSDPNQNGTHIVRWRERVLNGSGGPERYDAYLYEGTTLRATLANNLVLTDDTFTPQSYSLTTAEQDAISDWTDLRVRFVFDVGAAGEVMEISWVEFEVPDVFVSPTVSLFGFRFRTDDSQSLASTSGWEAAANTDVSLPFGKNFRVRIGLEETAGGTFSSALKLQYRINSGTWTDALGYIIDAPIASNAAVWCPASPQFAHGDAITTSQITGSAQTFTNGHGVEDTAGTVLSNSVTLSNQYTELEWIVRLPRIYDGPNYNDVGDTIDFRLVESDGTALTGTHDYGRVTITNKPGHIGGCPAESIGEGLPIIDSNGKMYYPTEVSEIDNEIIMMASTDGGTTWNPVDDAGRPGWTDLESLDVSQEGDTLHISREEGASMSWVEFYLSDHATLADTWGTAQDVTTGYTNTDQAGAVAHRDDGTVVAFYRKTVTNEGIYYKIRSTGGTWGSENELDTTASTEFTAVMAIKGSDSDVIHIFYKDDTNGDILHRSLLTNDTLTAVETVYGDAYTGGAGQQWAMSNPVVWDNGTNDYVMIAVQDHSDGFIYTVLITDDGTPASAELMDNVIVGSDMGGITNRQPGVTLAVDPATETVYAAFIDDTTRDMYRYEWTSGSGWSDQTTPVEMHDGETIDFVRGNVFTHSSGNDGAKVFGYVWCQDYGGYNDTTRYDEYVIQAGSTTYEDTGGAVSAATGSGASVVEYVKTGGGVSSLVGSGFSNQEYSRIGTGASPLVGSGDSQVEFVKIGSGNLISVGAGTGQIEKIKAGSATSILVGSGSDLVEFNKLGTGLVEGVGSGLRNSEYTRLGSATAILVGSGEGIQEYIDTGTGVAIGVGSGVSDATQTYEDTGTGVSTLTGSGTSIVEYNKVGGATSALTGSGESQVEFIKAGDATSELIGSGTGVAEKIRAGDAIMGTVGSGTGLVEYNKLGTGASVLSGSGTDIVEYVKTGGAVSESIGSGTKLREIVRTGSGIIETVGSGTAGFEFSKTGASISILVGSGVGVKEIPRTGAGTSILVGSGVRIAEYTEVGAGISILVGTGVSQVEFIKAGSAASILVGAGASSVEFIKTGAGISALTGSGPSVWSQVYAKTGAGISEGKGFCSLEIDVPGSPQYGRPTSDTAAGSWTTTPLWSKVDDDLVSSPTGDGVLITSDAVGNNGNTTDADLDMNTLSDPTSSVDHVIKVRWLNDGAGGSGRDIDGYVELWQGTPGTGTLIATLGPILLTGASATEQENTYTLTGTEANNITSYGTLQFRIYGIGSGGGTARSLQVEAVELEVPNATGATTTFWKTGGGRSELVGSGASEFVGGSIQKTGVGTSILVGAGADIVEYGKLGSGISILVGSGTDIWELDRTGVGLSILVGSGPGIAEFTKVGTGLLETVGSGVKELNHIKLGSALSELIGAGADIVESTDTGTGTSGLLGSGAKTVDFIKVGTGILISVGSGTKTVDWTKVGTGVLIGIGSGPSDVTTGGTEYIETGTATSILVGSGVSQVEFVKTATGVTILTGSGLRNAEYAELGTAVSILIGSGSDITEYVKLGTGIVIGVGSGFKSSAVEKTGFATSALTGTGTKSVEWVKTAASTSILVGSGISQIEFIKSNTGISILVGTGLRNAEYVEVGTGVIIGVGSGVSELAGQAVKAGVGITIGVGSATDIWELTRPGSGITSLVGAGTGLVEFNKSGVGISGLVGSGISATEGESTGVGTLEAVGTGVKVVEWVKEGSAVVITQSSGADVAEWIEEGVGNSVLTGSGLGTTEFNKVGFGVGVWSAYGFKEAEYSETGTGVIDLVGYEFVSGRLLPGQLTRSNLITVKRDNF